MDLLQKRLKVARWIAEELAGVITDEERGLLDKWRRESLAHDQEFETIKTCILAREEGKRRFERVNLAAEWLKFEEEHYRGRVLRRRICKYAAMFVLPLCIGGYLWSTWQPEVERTMTESFGIKPGSGKAQLILADGKRVELDESGSFQVEVKGANVLAEGKKITYRLDKCVVTPSPVEQLNTLVIPRGGEFVLELSDGTKVWMNSETKLSYPVCFSGDRRTVEMEGEAYFEVAKNAEVPFYVKVNGLEIKVLGTQFNVDTYEGRTITTLVRGKVCLTYRNESVILLPDMQAEVIEETGEMITKEVDAGNFALWKEGVFYFEDADLETIMGRLSRWYDVDVIYKDPGIKKLRFSVEMKRYDKIQDLLNKIEKTRKVAFQIQGKSIQVSR